MSHRYKQNQRLKRMMEKQPERFEQDDIRFMTYQSDLGPVEVKIEPITEANWEKIFNHIFPRTCPDCEGLLTYTDLGRAIEVKCPVCQRVISYLQAGC